MEERSSSLDHTLAPLSVDVQVLGSDELFPAICAFLPGQPTWLVTLERDQSPALDELKLTLEAKRGAGTPGLLPYLAIQQRDLRTLRRLWALHKQQQFRKKPKFWFHSAMHDAAANGNLEALEWLHENTTGLVCESSALSLAVTQGFTEVVQWFLCHHADVDLETAQRATAKAAASGLFDIVKAFTNWRRDVCTPQIMESAAANGHLEIVQFLHEQAHGRDSCTTDAVDRAAENGHVDTVKWLLANRTGGFSEAAMRGAVANGHCSVVHVLWESHGKLGGSEETTTKLMTSMRAGVNDAIRKQDGAMLRCVYELAGDAAIPRYALTYATKFDLDLVRFLLTTARPREDLDGALMAAIESADMMQYLLQHDSFSLTILSRTLDLAKSAKAEDVVASNILALEIAIAQKQNATIDETVVKWFDFEPAVLPTTSTTRTAPRSKLKATSRTVPRAGVQPRRQAFLA